MQPSGLALYPGRSREARQFSTAALPTFARTVQASLCGRQPAATSAATMRTPWLGVYVSVICRRTRPEHGSTAVLLAASRCQNGLLKRIRKDARAQRGSCIVMGL